MSPRTLHLPHGLAMAVLLVSLPTTGYLMSLPAGTLPLGALAFLGIIALGAVAMASASVGSAEAEVEALRAQIAWRDGAISRLNELVREDERIIEVLSATNQSIKGELAVSAAHKPAGQDGMAWRHAVPDLGLDQPAAGPADGRSGAGIGPQQGA